MSNIYNISLPTNIMEEQKITDEDLMGPPRVDIIQVGLSSLWSIVSGFIGSIIIVLSIYLFLKSAQSFIWIYPYIYISTVTMAMLITSAINIFMNKIINPEKYKRWSIVFTQVFLLNIFLYIILIFAYVFVANKNIDYLIYIFSAHVIIAMLGASLLTEILSSYRYVLLGIYWSIIWSLFSILLTSIVFLSLWESNKNLYVLIWLLIIINFATISIKSLFEYLYHLYYTKTWMDQLWDIYYQIELEEKEQLKKAQQELEKF